MRLILDLMARDRPLAEFLASNAHAFTRSDLVSGWSRVALERVVHDGNAERILPGVYCGRAHRAHPVVMGEALNLWHPAGLVTGPLAVHLYAPSMPVPAVAHVRVINGRRPRAPSWVRTIQGDSVTRKSYPKMIGCTVPQDAVLDAWRVGSPGDRLDFLWQALWTKVCTARQLSSTLAQAHRVPSRSALQQVLNWFRDGATSPLEVRAKYETFADARFREFEWQVPLVFGPRRAVVDMLHRRAMVVVELDGDRFHSTVRARNDDRNRQTDLTAAGYSVVRFGWNDITQRPEWCRERVLRTVAGRLARRSGT
ncbi:type IV toxin-antitoxin system AbiEi family antitoxin domain-containing protein [Demequina sp. NBRC 110055]|uniref:type IV toxin-antitoxin system AbiEi family antitoxin domain-containing protein n=1 Tax=Demequina sp. NBRC 110055 TaxID=1570344 RepID=UPI00135662D8|nr:type IV toxin-antitoxin system AbiEi family antitoxin domain-containing protein [Demequina sp. NBRC 110055]